MIRTTKRALRLKYINQLTYCVSSLLVLLACEDRQINRVIDRATMPDQSLTVTDSEAPDQELFTEPIDYLLAPYELDSDSRESERLISDQMLVSHDAEIGNDVCMDHPNINFDVSADSRSMIYLERCESPKFILNLAQGSKWKLTLKAIPNQDSADDALDVSPFAELNSWGLFDSLHWRIYQESNRQEDRLETAGIEFTSDTQELSFEFDAGLSGKHMLQLYQADDELWSINDVLNIEAHLTCLDHCELNSTLYPLVLVHGYAGVDQYFGVLDYFYRVPNRLRERGFSVYVPSLSPIELSTIRASELSSFLDQAQVESGAEKFNLIAHSQGGLDSRYLISSLQEGDRIASLTTVATPHEGLPIELLDFFSRQSFSEAELNSFNQNNPADPQVSYFSWSARTCTALEWSCLREHGGELVTPFLLATYTLLRVYGANDGLIMTDSMIYGTHLGELSADHFDQIGQIADQRDGAFPHLDFYVDEALRLARSGF